MFENYEQAVLTNVRNIIPQTTPLIALFEKRVGRGTLLSRYLNNQEIDGSCVILERYVVLGWDIDNRTAILRDKYEVTTEREATEFGYCFDGYFTPEELERDIAEYEMAEIEYQKEILHDLLNGDDRFLKDEEPHVLEKAAKARKLYAERQAAQSAV